jgi:hypothetical protein
VASVLDTIVFDRPNANQILASAPSADQLIYATALVTDEHGNRLVGIPVYWGSSSVPADIFAFFGADKKLLSSPVTTTDAKGEAHVYVGSSDAVIGVITAGLSPTDPNLDTFAADWVVICSFMSQAVPTVWPAPTLITDVGTQILVPPRVAAQESAVSGDGDKIGSELPNQGHTSKLISDGVLRFRSPAAKSHELQNQNTSGRHKQGSASPDHAEQWRGGHYAVWIGNSNDPTGLGKLAGPIQGFHGSKVDYDVLYSDMVLPPAQNYLGYFLYHISWGATLSRVWTFQALKEKTLETC